MARSIQQERDYKLKLCRRYLTIFEIFVLYLIVDYMVLRLTDSGGYLFWQHRYSQDSVVARFDYWPNSIPPYVELDYHKSIYHSRAMNSYPPPGTITVLDSSRMPAWAPLYKDQPEILINFPANNELPSNFVAQSVERVAQYDTAEAHTFQRILEEASKPKRLDYIGIARTLIALICVIGIGITIPLFVTQLLKARTLSRSIRLNSCTCGYSLAGLTSPTCPECGRTIAAPPVQQSTTLDP